MDMCMVSDNAETELHLGVALRFMFGYLLTGHHYYTIGQRARIGGRKCRYFVCGKDAAANVVTVAEGSDHPALYTHSFTTLPPHWISHDPFRKSCDLAVRNCSPIGMLNCTMRFRHQQPLGTCTVQQINKWVEKEMSIGKMTFIGLFMLGTSIKVS